MTPGKSKARLRQQLLEARSQLPPGQKYLWENAIAKSVLAQGAYQEAAVVLGYYATPQEISTEAILAHALCCGKRVALPRCRPGGGMDFCLFTHAAQLTQAFGGIPQAPASAQPLPPDALRGAFCLVPAVGASLTGHRIGTGGGYYDRFLVGFWGTAAILAYHWSVVDFPPDPWDIPAQMLFTPQGRQL